MIITLNFTTLTIFLIVVEFTISTNAVFHSVYPLTGVDVAVSINLPPEPMRLHLLVHLTLINMLLQEVTELGIFNDSAYAQIDGLGLAIIALSMFMFTEIGGKLMIVSAIVFGRRFYT